MNADEIPSDLITTKEAATLTKTHIATVRRWVEQGKLQGYRLAGYQILVSRADVLNLIQPYVKHTPTLPPTRRSPPSPGPAPSRLSAPTCAR